MFEYFFRMLFVESYLEKKTSNPHIHTNLFRKNTSSNNTKNDIKRKPTKKNNQHKSNKMNSKTNKLKSEQGLFCTSAKVKISRGSKYTAQIKLVAKWLWMWDKDKILALRNGRKKHHQIKTEKKQVKKERNGKSEWHTNREVNTHRSWW